MKRTAFYTLPESRAVRGSDKIAILSARRSRSSACCILFMLLTLIIMGFIGWMPWALAESYKPKDLNLYWVKAKVDYFFVLLDTSASMNAWVETGNSGKRIQKIDLAKTFIREMIQTMPNDVETRAGMRTFPNQIDELQYGLRAIKKRQKNLFLEKIDKIDFCYGTKSFMQVISKTLDDLKSLPQNRDVDKLHRERINILIISDFSYIGKEKIKEEEIILNGIAEAKKDKKYDVCFYAIHAAGRNDSKNSLAEAIGKKGGCAPQDGPTYAKALDYVANPKKMSRYVLDVFLRWPLPPQAASEPPVGEIKSVEDWAGEGQSPNFAQFVPDAFRGPPLPQKAFIEPPDDNKIKSRKELKLGWTLWAGKSEDPQFTPGVTDLEPGEVYTITLALSALGNDNTCDTCALHNCSMTPKLLKKEGAKTAYKVQVYPPGNFEKSNQADKDFSVNLQKLKDYSEEYQIDGHSIYPYDFLRDQDPEGGMSSEPDSVPNIIFGHVNIPIQVRSPALEGPARFTITLSSNDGKVADSLFGEFCIRSAATNPSPCPKGSTSVPLAQKFPLLSFYKVDNVIHGRFRTVGRPEVSWSLDKYEGELRNALFDWVAGFPESVDETKYIEKGNILDNILFPSERNDAKIARKAFMDFVGRNAPKKGGKIPSLYVESNIDPPIWIPIGLIPIPLEPGKKSFLGFHFIIESKLPMSSDLQPPISTCISRWIMLVPSREQADDTLREAYDRSAESLDDWKKKILELAKFPTMDKFGSWLIENDKVTEPACIMTLSHHDSDMMKFEPKGPSHVQAFQIIRRFQRPSVAILNGCGTANPGYAEFVHQLNLRGVDAIIATSTKVDPKLAGDFINSLHDVLKDCDTPVGCDIAQIYHKTILSLSGKKPDARSPTTWGARALSYTLLGNGNLLLCQPKINN